MNELTFTSKLVQNNFDYLENKRDEIIHCVQAPMVMAKVVKWEQKLKHWPKGIGKKIQFFMTELSHEDVLALYSVLLKGITQYNAHWQSLMPIWGRCSIWRDKLDEYGWELFEKAHTCCITYEFDEYAASLLLKQGFEIVDNSLTIDHDWETFSKWAVGFNIMEGQSIVRIKPVNYTNNPWCPRSTVMVDAEPKSKVRT